MQETGDHPDEREREPRTTEQGDELTDEHAPRLREGERVAPYRPARQPAQDPPAGGSDEP